LKICQIESAVCRRAGTHINKSPSLESIVMNKIPFALVTVLSIATVLAATSQRGKPIQQSIRPTDDQASGNSVSDFEPGHLIDCAFSEYSLNGDGEHVASFARSVQEDGLTETLGSHFVRLEDGNRFSGTISGISGTSGEAVGIAELNVYLVQESAVSASTKTNAAGEFGFEGIAAGTYSFCIAGQDGFLAHGLHLIEPSPEGDNGNQNASVESELSSHIEIFTRVESSSRLSSEITAAVIPPDFTALQQIMNNLLPSSIGQGLSIDSDQVRINVEESIVAGGFVVSLGPNGSMKGRAAPITSEKAEPIRINDLNVFLLKDDEIYSRATVESDGTFEFLDVEPGVYGFVAAGNDGFAALSFQAKKPDPEKDGDDIPTKSMNVGMLDANVFEVAICPANDSPFLRGKINELAGPVGIPGEVGVPGFGAPISSSPFANPSFGGSSVSSGGGFSGGRRPLFRRPGLLGLGGFGGLAGLAGIDGMTAEDASPDELD